MNLRFRVLKQAFNILPSAYSCATAGTPADKLTIGLKIYVNGGLLLDAPIGTLTDLTTDTDTVEGITSEFSVENTDYFKVNIGLTEARLSSLVRIIVYGGESHYDYDTQFTVFGYDLGNNPNIVYPPVPPFLGNPDMDITLAPRVFTGDGVVTNNKPCIKFAAYRNPITQAIHILMTTSAPGDYSYAWDNLTVASGKAPFILDPDGLVTELDGTGTNGDDVVTKQLAVPAPNGAGNFGVGGSGIITGWSFNTPLICEGCDCIQAETEVIVGLSYNSYTPFVVDDGYKFAPATSYLLTFELIDMTTNSVVDTAAEVIVVDPDISLTNFTRTYEIPDAIPFDRMYRLHITTTQGATLVDEEYVDLIPCNLKEVDQTECGSFTFTNKATDAIVKVYKVGDDGVNTEISVNIVALGDSFDFTLADGVYIIEITRDAVVVNNYKVFVHCAVTECFHKFAKALACSDPCADGDCGCGCGDGPGDKTSVYNFSAFMNLVMTYLQLVNANYAVGYIATTITDEIQSQLTDTAKILSRITDYCDGCDNC
jgi:hypothetical protein